MNYQVYILENPNGKIYIGISADVSHRLEQHNAGESRYTKNKGPWNVVWTSVEMSLSEARRLENKMKRQKGGQGLETLKTAYGS